MSESIVRIEHLSHRYTSNWAIKDINFSINRRGILGLLGSNGAGKSTTMNIICGVLNQTQGEVFINGINVRQQPIEAKKHLGFLPQNAPLYMDLTVREYLLYAANLRGMDPKIIPTALDEAMAKCGITHVQHRLLKNLSGGYRQRAGLAQAIVHRPALVILDEPTNGLDPLQIAEVRNLIRDISQEHTVLFSSHILSEVQLLCQEIIMIEQGQLVFSDSIDAFNNYIAPQSMLVSFAHAPSVEVLGQIAGVTRVERLKPGTFRIFYDGSTATSERIIVQSVDQKWRMIELAIEKNSVDEIFKQLTQKARKN